MRGRNYYPHDLEWTAQHAHPGLRRGGGAAFSIDDQAGERVMLVHEIEPQLSDSELTDVLHSIRRVVADEHELELHHVVLIKSGTIPKTSSGKIQRAACRAAYESGHLTIVKASTLDATTDGEDGETASDGPSTPIENRLADIWQEVLGMARPHPQENFFAVGGNSLLAAQLTSRILDEFHVNLPLSVVFECTTFSALASHITQLSVTSNSTERTIPGQRDSGGIPLPIVSPFHGSTRGGRRPRSASQRRLWFYEQIHPASAINHIPLHVRLRGPIDARVLERSVREIVHRHEILRTRFVSERGEGFAERSSDETFTIAQHDFTTQNRTAHELEVRQFLRQRAGDHLILGKDRYSVWRC